MVDWMVDCLNYCLTETRLVARKLLSVIEAFIFYVTKCSHLLTQQVALLAAASSYPAPYVL